MRVTYGRQQMYRSAGTEPACGSCVHFGAKRGPRETGDDGKRYCPEKQWYVPPTDICTSYEREPGAD